MIFFKTIILSFNSDELYREVVLKWKKAALGYLFLLVALLSLPLGFYIYGAFHRQLENNLTPYLIGLAEQLPAVRIKSGEVSIDRAGPQFIKDGSGKNIAVIDTSGKYRSLADIEKGALILMTKNKVFYSEKDNQTRIYDLGEQLFQTRRY